MYRTLTYRNFKKVRGELRCPKLDDCARIRDNVSAKNLWFRVFTEIADIYQDCSPKELVHGIVAWGHI